MVAGRNVGRTLAAPTTAFVGTSKQEGSGEAARICEAWDKRDAAAKSEADEADSDPSDQSPPTATSFDND